MKTLLSTLVSAALSTLSSAADPAPAPASTHVYFGTYTSDDGSKGIYHASLDLSSGKLSEPTLAAETPSPSFVAIHPKGHFLYAVGEIGGDPAKSKALSAFAINPATGTLSLLNRQSTGGPGPCHVAVDPAGKVALVANYGGGSVSSVPINPDGSLAPPASFHQHVGSSVNPRRQSAPHAHSINVSPDGAFALAADLGLDKILIYKLDPASGKLAPNDPPFAKTPEGGGPRHLSFHPSGKFAFANDEMQSTVTAYTFDPASGTLSQIASASTLPAGFDGGNSTAETLVHPGGKFLYVSNRGHNSIAAFAIDQDTGKLTPVEIEPTGGEVPRGFGIDPTGAYLVVANQKSGSVHVFAIDPSTGTLEPTGSSVSVHSPVCVRFLLK